MKSTTIDRPIERYLFKSERLGFRQWLSSDFQDFHAMCTDPDVMRYFPRLYTPEESKAFIQKMQNLYSERGYCFYVAERLDNGQFIGFTGFSYQNFKTPFSPFTEIGWRLMRSQWGKGYTTEAARRCLSHGSNSLALRKIYAIAPTGNLASLQVMQKIGMKKKGSFLHPDLKAYPEIARLDLYSIDLP